MPIETAIWRVDGGLQRVRFSNIEAEAKLEELIEQDISLIDPDLMVIGRQVLTAYGKLIDLLAIDSEGHLVIVELKRAKTPREVVAQALDYASWVQGLSYDDITSIYREKDPKRHFEQAFAERFGSNPPETLNEELRMVVVASELDTSTERIINYLVSNFGVPINVVFFRYFKDAGREYLSRTWLIDPMIAEEQAAKKPGARVKESWNGRDFYVSFGEGPHRSWEDALKYGFVSAGQSKWYSNTLAMLFPEARVFVRIPKAGYVGVATVVETAVRVRDFTVQVDGVTKPILAAPLKALHMAENADNEYLSEYLVRVEWLKTLPIDKGIKEKGLFANENSACRLRNKFTLERLAIHFELED